jgi:hypothetical protein
MYRPIWLILALAIVLGGCTPDVDLTEGLEVLDVSSGWRDAGVVDGKNKIVPSLSLKLKNVSDQKLGALQLNVLFRRVTEPDTEWGSSFMTASPQGGLPAEQTTEEQVAVSDLGYTGTEPLPQMLQHRLFVDTTARVFAKYGSRSWTLIGEYPVERRILE